MKIHSCRVYREGGDPLTPTCVTSKHHLVYSFRIKFVAAILLTCCGHKCAVFERKINHFEAVNRKNNRFEKSYKLNEISFPQHKR